MSSRRSGTPETARRCAGCIKWGEPGPGARPPPLVTNAGSGALSTGVGDHPSAARPGRRSERDVAVHAAVYADALDRIVDGTGDGGTGLGGLDHRVDDPDLDGPLDPAREPLVLGSQLGLHAGAQ